LSPEATIAGEGCHLVLQVHGYEFQDAQRLDSDDANWLRGRVDLVTEVALRSGIGQVAAGHLRMPEAETT
jgi:hypothetical protein